MTDYEANKQERLALGLHPKMGQQSLAETRRILMTWTKDDLVGFLIRDESDMLKAIDRAVAAEMALRDHRRESITLSKPPTDRPKRNTARTRAWEIWQHPRKGQIYDPQTIFEAGWIAAVDDIATGGE